jgi:hypothetical protein
MTGHLHASVASSPRKIPRYPLDRTRRLSGSGGKEKNSYFCRESILGRPVCSLVTTLTYLPRLRSLHTHTQFKKFLLSVENFFVLYLYYDTLTHRFLEYNLCCLCYDFHFSSFVSLTIHVVYSTQQSSRL